jgi:hypothetical protein
LAKRKKNMQGKQPREKRKTLGRGQRAMELFMLQRPLTPSKVFIAFGQSLGHSMFPRLPLATPKDKKHIAKPNNAMPWIEAGDISLVTISITYVAQVLERKIHELF